MFIWTSWGFGLLFLSILKCQNNFVTKAAAALMVVGPSLSPGNKGSPAPQPPFCHTEMHKQLLFESTTTDMSFSTGCFYWAVPYWLPWRNAIFPHTFHSISSCFLHSLTKCIFKPCWQKSSLRENCLLCPIGAWLVFREATNEVVISDNSDDSTYGGNIWLDALNWMQTHQPDPPFYCANGFILQRLLGHLSSLSNSP